MNRFPHAAALVGALFAVLFVASPSGPTRAAGDTDEGARLFRACRACHSLEPGRHMTGPSLAGIWGRRAGTQADFPRYSPALKEADVVWDEASLDAWLADPTAFVPNNRMTFPGLRDPKARRDLIAYLKEATASAASPAPAPPTRPSLRAASADQRVSGIRYCAGTYAVQTATGDVEEFWEFNLRFKTDSSDLGPAKGAPVLMSAGMMGDRAFVVFAGPEEISASIRAEC